MYSRSKKMVAMANGSGDVEQNQSLHNAQNRKLKKDHNVYLHLNSTRSNKKGTLLTEEFYDSSTKEPQINKKGKYLFPKHRIFVEVHVLPIY